MGKSTLYSQPSTCEESSAADLALWFHQQLAFWQANALSLALFLGTYRIKPRDLPAVGNMVNLDV